MLFMGNDLNKESTLIIRLVVAGFLAGMALSYPLWTTFREFPSVPLIGFSPAVLFPFDVIFILLLAIGLIWLIIKQNGLILWITVGLALVVFTADQLRWQPWAFLYFIMLIILGLGMQRGRRNPETLNTLRLMLVCVYFYSGIVKINTYFFAYGVYSFFPWMYAILPGFTHSFLPVLNVFIIIAEILLAAGLVFNTTREKSAKLLMLMHFGIAFFIVLVNKWNPVIFPWNMVMISLLYILFIRNSEAKPLEIFWNNGNLSHIVVILLLGVLPALSLVDKWDKYLSSHLYSFTTDNAIVEFDPDATLPEDVIWQPYVNRTDSTQTLNIFRWSMASLKAPVYPESRIFRSITDEICAVAREDIIQIHYGLLHFEKDREEVWLCEE